MMLQLEPEIFDVQNWSVFFNIEDRYYRFLSIITQLVTKITIYSCLCNWLEREMSTVIHVKKREMLYVHIRKYRHVDMYL